jgi:hypothetical protein
VNSKEDEILSKVRPLLDAAHPHPLARELRLPSKVDSEVRRGILAVRSELGALIRAFLEFHSVLEDVIACHRMVRRYPWKGKGISRARHLRLVWFQFMNLCYLFREKFKLFASCYRRVMAIFGETSSVDLKGGLSRIDAALGKFIKNRGRSFHEWYEIHDSVRHFELIEVLNTAKRVDGPLSDVKGHYSDAKFFLSLDIRSAAKMMEEFVLHAIARDLPAVLRILDRFNKLIRDIEADPSIAARSIKISQASSRAER